MYKIFADSTIIFDDVAPVSGLKLIEPKLTLEENCAGSLSFKVPPDGVAYDIIYPMTTELIVTQDDIEIWRGRAISETTDFWKCKKYTCEGELAYLNDSIQLPRRYLTSNTNIRSFLESLLSTHNSQVGSGSNKRFSIGSVTVDDGDTLEDSNAINRYTNYENTIECINEKLVDRLGGHLRIRHSGNTRYLDYFKSYSEIGASDQVIRFGSNLLDYVSNLDSIDWVTAIAPRGKRLEIDESEQPVPGLEAYTNVSTVPADGTWHSAGSMFVVNQEMVNRYGFIAAVVDWSEVADPTILKNKAKKYLQSVIFDQMCLEISAVDLHYLNPNIETLKLQETVRCISDPHGMDTSFPITKIDIDMLNPSNTKYTLGTKVSTSLTTAQNKANDALRSYVDDTFVPSESSILDSAKSNATELINGAAQGGVASWIYGIDGSTGNAVINQTAATPKKPTGIRVANTIEDANATNRWLWTTGGLGHYSRANTSTPWKNVAVNTAITMDGKIVADFVTAGMLKLTGATTQSSDKATGYQKALFMKVYGTYNGASNQEIGHWGSDGILIKKGQIQLGVKNTTHNRFPFIVYDSGAFEITTYQNGAPSVKFDSTNGLWMHQGEISLGYPNDDTKTGCSISSGGQLIAKNANIKGTLYVGGDGQIQLGNKVSNRYPFYVDKNGFQITSYQNGAPSVKFDSSGGLWMHQGEISLGYPNDDSKTGCSISSSGQLIAKNANIKGTLEVAGDGVIKLGTYNNYHQRWPFYVDKNGFQMTVYSNGSPTVTFDSWSGLTMKQGSIRLGDPDYGSGVIFNNDGGFKLRCADNQGNEKVLFDTSVGIKMTKGSIRLGDPDYGSGFEAKDDGTLKLRGGSLKIGDPDYGSGIEAKWDGTLKIRGGELFIGDPYGSTGIHAKWDGTLVISGKITAKEGNIGGFNIGNDHIGDPIGNTKAIGMISGDHVYAYHPSHFVKMYSTGLVAAGGADLRVYNGIDGSGNPSGNYVKITSGAVQSSDGTFVPFLTDQQYNKLMSLVNS